MAHILILEDDPEQRNLLVRRLAAEGHQVSFAENGKEALKSVVEDKPDLVVLDVTLPDKSGWDVARLIRSYGETSTLPILFLTARRGAINEYQSVAMGGDAYLEKPWEAGQLMEIINRLLRK